MANRVTMTICGTEYILVAEEDAAYMEKIGSMVDTEMRSLMDSAHMSRDAAAVLAAAEKNEPYIVSRATMEVCTAFNKFYFCNQIITEDAGVSAARLALTDAARITIKKGLYLVGLQAPERM